MPTTISALPVAGIVKESTQPLHSETERLLFPKLSSIQSADDYAVILKMFYGYYLPLEEKIQQHITASLLADVHERRNAGAALHDLKSIGKFETNLPLCSHLPSIKNAAQAFGALYVLEGSTLGGKMIAKMLLKNTSFPLTENSVTFFAGYKEETGNKWKTFLEAFNRQDNVDEMVQSATDTFFYLKRWIQQTLYNE